VTSQYYSIKDTKYDDDACMDCILVADIENDKEAKCDKHTTLEEISFSNVLKEYS